MDQGGPKENECIRIPRRARLFFDNKGQRLRLIAGRKESALQLKQAYKEDLRKLLGQLKGGHLTEDQVKRTGFVTTATYKRLVGRATRRCYLSESVENIKIGADPEFALVNPGNRRYQYAQYVEGIRDKDGSLLGSDGPVAEVRPPPAKKVATMVSRISNALHKRSGVIKTYDWVAGATYASPNHPQERVVFMGGHLHLGRPSIADPRNVNGIYARIAQVLDETVAVPLVKIDGPDAWLRRNTRYNGYGRYGRWGDWRNKPDRMEWRVLSGLWLAHPHLAQSIVGTTKALTEHCFQMMAEHGFKAAWINAPRGEEGFLTSWGAMNERVAAEILNGSKPGSIPTSIIDRAAKKLTGLSNYRNYKAEIDAFVELLYLTEPNFNLDMKDTWLHNGNVILGG
jgi:hypothetical protein